MTTWVFEDKVFSDKFYEIIHKTMKTLSVPYHMVRVIPFLHEIEGTTPTITDHNIVIYGSIGLQSLAKKNNWLPGVWAGETFSESYYAPLLKDLYFNYDSQKMQMTEILLKVKMKEFFIKPDADTKEFAGQIMKFDEFSDWYTKMMNIGYLDNNDFPVSISSPKQIGQEIRVVVVDRKISSASIYRKYRMLYERKIEEDSFLFSEIESIWNKVSKVFVPAPVFAMDLVQTDDGYKVLEFNSFNSAGMYACDFTKIVSEINIFLEK